MVREAGECGQRRPSSLPMLTPSILTTAYPLHRPPLFTTRRRKPIPNGLIRPPLRRKWPLITRHGSPGIRVHRWSMSRAELSRTRTDKG
jgi:hypothetical protein